MPTPRKPDVAVRVIACLDVDAGRVVKGVNFADLRDAGDPVELAARYGRLGIDELVFLDVTASTQDRDTMHEVVQRAAGEVFIPLTVGGGVRSVEDVDRLLRDGADKASVNTAAVVRPELIDEVAERFGSQVLTLSLDARRSDATESGFEVTVKGGREGTGRCAVEWAREAERRGVGEILLNSIDADGTRDGFDVEMIRAVRAAVTVPLIASGGAGEPAHFPAAVAAGADAVLAASVFHFGADDAIAQVKDALRASGASVR
ncbi:imidazole glycerol phosphate synthase subunit HisF [Falsarthrobacter nasiphocae]|uniref:Imidazole glycerol phosphate synthase subunit HisF n=1 Tax=Falsarthrobacter nasiphocae TaxID=189863 RepID=A0AAE4C4C7_9MICC|nr:imidazole glycerol phosphate synthase subunit HisF [Falsarthrobacter nasiphocae]MDR6891231.1 cyclase [Falsarthrobacter nasiphocae]